MDEIVLFSFGFGADGERVEDSCAKGVADGFGGFVAEVTLSEDLHADNSLPLCAHLLDHADDGGGVRVHMGADGVETDKIDFDPRGGCSCL